MANAQLIEAFEGGANAYATVRDIHHKIQWWAILLAGAIITASMRAMTWIRLGSLALPLQKAIANFLYFIILFCSMLILIQFEPYWMPVLETSIEWVGDLI